LNNIEIIAEHRCGPLNVEQHLGNIQLVLTIIPLLQTCKKVKFVIYKSILLNEAVRRLREI
jgi:hypothetical protein